MIILFLATLVPYIWLILGSNDFVQPPADVITMAALSCALYHASFIYYCRKLGYGFITITCFFFWIFMGLAPVMCSLTGRWLWGDMTVNRSNDIVYSCFLCVLFFILALVFHRVGFRYGALGRFFLRGGRITDGRILTGLWFSLLMAIVVVITLGIQGTFFRTGIESYVSTGLLPLFVQNFVRPMPLLVGVPMAWILTKGRLAWASPRLWLALAVVAMALIVNFPLSVARYYGLMVIAVFVYYILLQRRFIRRTWLAGVFLIGGFLASFVVDAARYATSASEMTETFTQSAQLSVDSFYVGHVDAFEMLVYGTQYVDASGTTLGRQFAGVLAFWVPREIWPDKPVPTGVLLGSSFINIMSSTANVNLSAPIVLEAYINFGVIGVILGAIMTGLLIGTLDRALAERRGSLLGDGETMVCRIDCVAAPALGLWIYILRGSLLSAFAYTSGIVVAGLVVWYLFFSPLAGFVPWKIRGR